MSDEAEAAAPPPLFYGWALADLVEKPAEEEGGEPSYIIRIVGYTTKDAEAQAAPFAFPLCHGDVAVCFLVVADAALVGYCRDRSLLGAVLDEAVGLGSSVTFMALSELPEVIEAGAEEFARDGDEDNGNEDAAEAAEERTNG